MLKFQSLKWHLLSCDHIKKLFGVFCLMNELLRSLSLAVCSLIITSVLFNSVQLGRDFFFFLSLIQKNINGHS